MSNQRTLLVALILVFASVAGAQAGLGLLPGRVEVGVPAGGERTVAFEVEAPGSDNPVRGRLLLSLTDWSVSSDAKLIYGDANTMPNSACSWVTYSPAAFSITSGQKQLVRVTVRVPEGTPDGVYRAGIFIQERPPATPPKMGEHQLILRFRYVFILYVLVGEMKGQGELDEVGLVSDQVGVRVPLVMTNKGTMHVRPVVRLTVRDMAKQAEILDDYYEAIIVLPAATQKEEFALAKSLAPGRYEVHAQVDFQDGRPVKSLKRIVDVTAPSPAAPAAVIRIPGEQNN
jgi:P pilus assembly chaperone PapD